MVVTIRVSPRGILYLAVADGSGTEAVSSQKKSVGLRKIQVNIKNSVDTLNYSSAGQVLTGAYYGKQYVVHTLH